MSDDDHYHVAITATAACDLKRLPEKAAAACVEFIFGSLVENPHRLGKPLRNDLAGLRSARRGDYRVIYLIDDRNRRIAILHIARRSDVYRLQTH
ncbi:type II toxin-antitoxin system RelE family toxin [Mycobacterium branderi]|uniref:Toxin RelE n=1 Tax=Mycobacterium branderi TaxID=43348 RepID=A0A7I7W9W0_9MYCO|nr:type II toxin-antitoxin system RelE/ParE family toxin [Mycobacterium branderi]MCV7231473.1 type II toxin-antitoxin system RelE/ParE family toxin [Mycobacterium branderi]ORA37446.1 addiction module toxin RelE [Mycobacterium branderi]BBZ13535.1 toxin RelE [Mycobacterium branderi]